MTPTSESPGPDSAVSTPTEHKQTSAAEDFAKVTLLSSAITELKLETSENDKDNPSIQVDSNNKEMKNVLEKASSTEVITSLTLDTKLKSGSVASLGRSDSYGSVASTISNGIYEKAGSFTSIASTHSMQHQTHGSHHGLVRYRSASGRPLSDIVSTVHLITKSLLNISKEVSVLSLKRSGWIRLPLIHMETCGELELLYM